MPAALGLLLDNGHRPARRGGAGRRQGRRENVGPGVIDQPIHQRLRTADKTALRSQGFAQSTDLNEAIFTSPGLKAWASENKLGKASAPFPNYPSSMGFID